MSKYPVSQEVKEQILKRIREDGVPVSQAATEHGVHYKTVYGWLAKGVTAQPSLLEVSRLKRENQALHEIIGRLTVKLSVAEKKDADR